MELPRSMDNYEIQLPVPLQLYLWKQLRPFIRVKLGRVHEASCVFCQRAPGHHEMKEACTVRKKSYICMIFLFKFFFLNAHTITIALFIQSLERVLVQNIHNELTPPLRQLLGTVPRWRFIQASFPFIVHAAANILHNKSERESGSDSKSKGEDQRYTSSSDGPRISSIDHDVRAATFFDVAVIRCLFLSQWQEEGIFWALQFLYNRLRRINEESSVQQMPRRRSNSLPIPKIEVSIYQSPESKKKDDEVRDGYSQDTHDSTTADVNYYGDDYKVHETDRSHMRRASEKTKRRMKMADLKAFVETKLLSKSEKALEKIGQEEPKMTSEDSHRSLDTGEEQLSRQPSISSRIFDAKEGDFLEHSSNLLKGKSMPSLRYIGEPKVERKQSRFYSNSCAAPNPIITVTEHTPVPSPDYMKRQGSMDSQLDAINSHGTAGRRSIWERKPSLTRSQTDSNITYSGDEPLEAPGSSCFITKDGDIDIEVVLKAIHNVTFKDNQSCSLRVCESILNLIELLMDMGVLTRYTREESVDDKDSCGKSESGKRQQQQQSQHHQQQHQRRSPSDSEAQQQQRDESSPHVVALNTVVRILRHLGCPHGCNEGTRGPQADFCRSQIQTILGKLHEADRKQFSTFLRGLCKRSPTAYVIDLFHAYLGFCVDPGSLLSPLNQKRGSSKSPDSVPQGSYATNFGAGMMGGIASANNMTSCNSAQNAAAAAGGGIASASSSGGSGYNTGIGPGGGGVGGGGIGNRFRSIESQIMGYVFKTIVTKCCEGSKSLRSQDNIALYCDVRQLMTYIKEAHGGVFRRVALSCILDSADRPNRVRSEPHQAKVIRHINLFDLDPSADVDADGIYTVDDKTGARKYLFKKRSASSAGAAVSSRAAGAAAASTAELQSKLPFHSIFQSLLETDLSDDNVKVSNQSPVDGVAGAGGGGGSGSGVGNVRKKHHALTPRQSERNLDLNEPSFGIRKSRKTNRLKIGGIDYSRKDSLDIEDATRETEFVVLKERRLVPKQAILDGMLRFSFLLDTCHPGTVPDHHLMAALLDLPGAPVVCRAAILLECASYVHQCNKGHWPIWMKSNFPMFRPSMALNNRGAPTGIRRTHVLQRAGGKLFYQWAEAVGSRLEQFLAEDRACADKIQEFVENDKNHAFLLAQEEEEDFLDEASIASYGSKVPMALRLVACCLLMEITSFLRETYPSIPKSSRLSIKERAPPWEKLYSREANRRWSMALSSMGHSQTSAQSLQSIAGADGKETERKISFVLHEPDNESEGSSKSNVTIPGEEVGQNNERERAARRMTQQAPGRPFLLRRGTSGNTATGSFKRRSLKLRRNTKEGKEIEVDAYTIQSKRKVSSLSDRSDTSEPGNLLYGGGGGGGGGGEVSGEESPGILSDDQQPESPSDSNDTDDCTTKNFPWMRIVAQMTAHYHFLCDHQSFCHPFCHRRQMRAGEKLIKAVRKIYGEEFGYVGGMDMFTDPDAPEKKAAEEERCKKDKRCRKVSDQQSVQVSPVKRKDSMGRKLNKIDKSLDGSQSVIRESMKDLADHESNYARDFAKAMEPPEEDYKEKELSPVQKYMQIHVRNAFHAPIATLLKGAAIVTEDLFVSILPVAWELLLENNQEVAAAAASLFIVASVRAPSHATDIMHGGLKHANPEVRISSIMRFQVLWRHRYQVWQRMEEQAHATFKVPPPGIEFTLPSPKIGIESLPVVDPPWMPQVRTKVEEVTINQERHRALVTATKTRKKQQTELIKRALQAQDDKKKEERINFLITTIPITFQAAYEPSPVGDDHDDGMKIHLFTIGIIKEISKNHFVTNSYGRGYRRHGTTKPNSSRAIGSSSVPLDPRLLLHPHHRPAGRSVGHRRRHGRLPRGLPADLELPGRGQCSLPAVHHGTPDQGQSGQSVQDTAPSHKIHSEIAPASRFRAVQLHNRLHHVLRPIASRGRPETHRDCPVDPLDGRSQRPRNHVQRPEADLAQGAVRRVDFTDGQRTLGQVVVHGPQNPDDGGIPSQFPVQEDTQFCQILRESLDFFGIEESKHKEYFLVDHKTHQIHNPASYVRDYYFFKRSQYPQLELVHMEPEEAFNALQREELTHKFVEIGKVLLTWAILKNVDMVVQRVVFLHEELMKLPSFPRKALECDLDLYKGGEYGKQLLAFDVMHKFMWVRLIARMFEAMAGNFAYSGDIHLFINVLNGTLFLHSTDSCILRYVVATYINAAFNFKNIFSTNGYFLIIPTLMQLYSTHQTNKLVTTTVEYAVKQFYMMHRKPFILQMFGSVSAILDTDETSAIGEAHKVPSSCLFNLLLSLETPSPDPLNIGELVKEEKPLKAIDFCYHDESEMVTILDCISMCVMVVSYAADSLRGQQMLIILEAIMPCYVQQIQLPTYNKEGKTEKEIINQLAITVRTLVNNSESLAKYYNRPQKNSPEHKGSSQRNYGKSPYSPGFEFDEEANIGVPVRPPTAAEAAKNKQQVFDDDAESSHKNEFVRPRDTLLNMVGDFVARCSARLVELDKKSQDGKTIEILDSKCHIRLADVAHSLLKISPTIRRRWPVAASTLKIIIISFENDLTSEWPRILRTMKLLNKRNEASLHLWNFLEFVVTHRTPLYIQMMLFIIHKIGQAPISEHERTMQGIIRDRMNGIGMSCTKSKSDLLNDLINEWKKLKEEIEDRKIDKSYTSITTSDERNRYKPRPVLTRQKTSKLRFIPSIELRHSSGETITSQLSPNSPMDDSSGESKPDKPRLQRSMGASKRTFRLRKSRRAHAESAQSSSSRGTTEGPESSLSPDDQPTVHQASPQLLSPSPPATIEESSSTPPYNAPSDSSSVPSRRDSATILQLHHQQIVQPQHHQIDIDIDQPSTSGNGSHAEPSPQLSHRDPLPQGHPSLLHHAYLQLRPQSDISWDEDTSSTSGYRESYSLQLVSLESSNGNNGNNHPNGSNNNAPPLASPDLPSSSSTTTNYMAFDGSSPENSINSNGGERQALLTQSSQRTNSQHSLLVGTAGTGAGTAGNGSTTTTTTQDEDTLI
ncbi:unnamed protein product [Trichogramma brassicae]|uniref:Uncharacterized protein n=1 Tax=Trichogramma brassicae TaxID=86971 RepID=A0A6H5J5W5_9HYME|nr:unnamed protein product [Trichogramma brassicae]